MHCANNFSNLQLRTPTQAISNQHARATRTATSMTTSSQPMPQNFSNLHLRTPTQSISNQRARATCTATSMTSSQPSSQNFSSILHTPIREVNILAVKNTRMSSSITTNQPCTRRRLITEAETLECNQEDVDDENITPNNSERSLEYQKAYSSYVDAWRKNRSKY